MSPDVKPRKECLRCGEDMTDSLWHTCPRCGKPFAFYTANQLTMLIVVGISAAVLVNVLIVALLWRFA